MSFKPHSNLSFELNDARFYQTEMFASMFLDCLGVDWSPYCCNDGSYLLCFTEDFKLLASLLQLLYSLIQAGNLIG